jgi:hypothetical protein
MSMAGSTPSSHGRPGSPEELPVQVVHDVVVLLELRRHLDVAAGDDAARLGDDLLRGVAHLHDDAAQRRRDGRRGVAPTGDLRDVHGVVAHPLQVGHHPQRGDQHPQVAGDRLLARQQVEGPRLGLAVQRVHGLVVGDHRLGQLQVGVQQGGRRPAHGGAHQVGHLDQRGGDGVELVVVGVAHLRRVDGASRRNGVSREPPPYGR